MLATSFTAAILGVEAHLVSVEADSAPGFPRFTDGRARRTRPCARASRGSGPRCATAACRSSGTAASRSTSRPPACARAARRSTSRRRSALRRGRRRRSCCPSSLACCSSASWPSTAACVRCPGVLPMLLVARRHGLAAAVVPQACHREAALVTGLPLYPVASLPGGDRAPVGSGAARHRPRYRQARILRARPTSISPTSAARRSPGARSRSRPQAATTCCWSVRRDPARRCWPDACPASCPRSPRGGRRVCRHPLGRGPRGPTRPSAAGPSAARTTRRPRRPSSEAGSGPGRAR